MKFFQFNSSFFRHFNFNLPNSDIWIFARKICNLKESKSMNYLNFWHQSKQSTKLQAFSNWIFSAKIQIYIFFHVDFLTCVFWRENSNIGVFLLNTIWNPKTKIQGFSTFFFWRENSNVFHFIWVYRQKYMSEVGNRRKASQNKSTPQMLNFMLCQHFFSSTTYV